MWFDFVAEEKQKKVGGYWGFEHADDREKRMQEALRYQTMEWKDMARENDVMKEFIALHCPKEFETYRALEKLSGLEDSNPDQIEKYGRVVRQAKEV